MGSSAMKQLVVHVLMRGSLLSSIFCIYKSYPCVGKKPNSPLPLALAFSRTAYMRLVQHSSASCCEYMPSWPCTHSTPSTRVCAKLHARATHTHTQCARAPACSHAVVHARERCSMQWACTHNGRCAASSAWKACSRQGLDLESTHHHQL